MIYSLVDLFKFAMDTRVDLVDGRSIVHRCNRIRNGVGIVICERWSDPSQNLVKNPGPCRKCFRYWLCGWDCSRAIRSPKRANSGMFCNL